MSDSSGSPSGSPRYSALVFGLAACLFLVMVVRLTYYAWITWTIPTNLMYEAPSLSTTRIFEAGLNPYDPTIYENWAVLTMYTPVYYFVCSMFSSYGENPYLPGRMISFLSIVAALLLTVPWTRNQRRLGWSMLVIALALCADRQWNYIMHYRCDALANLFCVASMVLLAKNRAQSDILSALLAILAIGTKQSMIAPVLAGTFYLATQDRNRCWTYLVVVFASGIFANVIAYLVFGGGFFTSVLVFPQNPATLEQFLHVLDLTFLREPAEALLVVFSLIAVAMMLIGKDARNSSGFMGSPFPVYFLICFVIFFLTIPKLGSEINYFTPVIYSMILLLNQHNFATRTDSDAGWHKLAVLPVVIGLMGYQIVFRAPFDRQEAIRTAGAVLEGARFLNSTLDPILPHESRFGLDLRYFLFHPHIQRLPTMNDAYLWELLVDNGQLSHRPLAESIAREEFDYLLLPPTLDPNSKAGWRRDVAQAAAQSYVFLGYSEEFEVNLLLARKHVSKLPAR